MPVAPDPAPTTRTSDPDDLSAGPDQHDPDRTAGREVDGRRPLPGVLKRSTVSRRAALGGLGALGLTAVATACGIGGSSSASSPSSTAGASSSSSTAARPGSTGGSGSTGGGVAGGSPGTTAAGSTAACTLTPEQTEGPYYLDIDQVRRDITEGKPGTPLELTIQVLDQDGCTPRRDAAVDIWHCDAMGDYSGVNDDVQQGSPTFLRGTQVTDADGKVTFTTIYPGFYQGRAVHIHVKIHPTKTSQVTTQLYFPDDLSRTVFAAAPYSSHRGTITPNARDGIYRDGGRQLTLAPTKRGDGYQASFVAAVGASSGGGSSRL
ncbi:MAG: intradiol ring-cleavage dioxygenase [Acidimicrobiales bacterium]